MYKSKPQLRLWFASAIAHPRDNAGEFFTTALITEKAYATKRDAVRELMGQLYFEFDPKNFDGHELRDIGWVNFRYCQLAFGIDSGNDDGHDNAATPDPSPDIFERSIDQISPAGTIDWN